MASKITEIQIREANARGQQRLLSTPLAIAAKFNPRTHKIVVELDNHCEFSFPPEAAQGLTEGTQKQLSQIEISPTGLALHWPLLDADLYVPSLIQGIFGSKEWMRKIGRTGGSKTSDSKREAAQRNGRLGGRPRKVKALEAA